MPTQLLIDIAINAALYNVLLVGYQFHSTLKKTSNFAFGGLVVLGGYLFWEGRQSGWGVVGAVLFSLLGVFILAVVFDYIFALFAKRDEMKQEILLIVSIALLGAVEAVIQIVFGASTKVITIYSPTSIDLFGIKVTEQQIFLSLTAVTLGIILTVWLYMTRNGLAFRAMEEDQTKASSIALSTRTAKNIAAMIVIFTACIAGTFIASERSLNPHIGTGMVITAFVLATLGGKNARIWLLVCVLFSAFEVLVSWYFGSTLADAALYSLVFLYLLRERFTVSQWFNRLRNTYA